MAGYQQPIQQQVQQPASSPRDFVQPGIVFQNPNPNRSCATINQDAKMNGRAITRDNCGNVCVYRGPAGSKLNRAPLTRRGASCAVRPGTNSRSAPPGTTSYGNWSPKQQFTYYARNKAGQVVRKTSPYNPLESPQFAGYAPAGAGSSAGPAQPTFRQGSPRPEIKRNTTPLGQAVGPFTGTYVQTPSPTTQYGTPAPQINSPLNPGTALIRGTSPRTLVPAQQYQGRPASAPPALEFVPLAGTQTGTVVQRQSPLAPSASQSPSQRTVRLPSSQPLTPQSGNSPYAVVPSNVRGGTVFSPSLPTIESAPEEEQVNEYDGNEWDWDNYDDNYGYGGGDDMNWNNESWNGYDDMDMMNSWDNYDDDGYSNYSNYSNSNYDY